MMLCKRDWKGNEEIRRGANDWQDSNDGCIAQVVWESKLLCTLEIISLYTWQKNENSDFMYMKICLTSQREEANRLKNII